MKYITLLAKSTANEKGYPGDFPVQTMHVADDYKVDAPWVEKTKPEIDQLIAAHGPAVEAILTAEKDSNESQDRSKIQAMRQLFDDGDVIDNAWAAATNQQKFDLGRIAYKILRRQRRVILEQYKPE